MIRQLDDTRVSSKADVLTVTFKNRIIGQPKAFEALTQVLEKYNSGIYDRKRPIASLLFLGPTGVGKTGSVEAFVEGLFGNSINMMKVDCAEFQHSHEIAKLMGSPPGYLGHRETHPFFTNKAIREKFCKYTIGPGGVSVETGQNDPAFTVILFDEIEKANDALWNLLLGILDRGVMTTGTNEVVDFSPTVIIMTSNVGAAELAVKAGNAGLGFSPTEGTEFDYETMKRVAMSAARLRFTPEFLNRLDDTIVFRRLDQSDLLPIVKIELDKLRAQIILTSRSVFDFELSPAAVDRLVVEGYDPRYNARNLRRTIEKYVSLPLARMVGTHQILNNDMVIIDYVDGKWKYFAKTETQQGSGSSSVPSGRLEVPTLRKPIGATPAPPDVQKSWWSTLYGQPHNPLLDLPRQDTPPGIERRSPKRLV